MLIIETDQYCSPKNVTRALLHLIQCHTRKHYLTLNVSNINVVMTCNDSITKVHIRTF